MLDDERKRALDLDKQLQAFKKDYEGINPLLFRQDKEYMTRLVRECPSGQLPIEAFVEILARVKGFDPDWDAEEIRKVVSSLGLAVQDAALVQQRIAWIVRERRHNRDRVSKN